MSTKPETLTIANIHIDVNRKNIKNIHLSVNPPDGGVRISAPVHTDPEVIRLFAISKLAWIKKHIKGFQEQQRETPRTLVNGESHYFQGNRYLLEVVETQGTHRVEISGKKLKLFVRPSTSMENRARVLREWYRQYLKQEIPPIIEKWTPIMEVDVKDWGIKLMRTKWGACNVDVGRIWLNLHLAKKPPICLEYIIVHEMVHLLERHHNNHFIALMNHFMPHWRLHRDELNRLPLAHEDWGY
ncbi:MAG: SprT family zinc-dependent metalloprotease [Bacteroidota bacterium]